MGKKLSIISRIKNKILLIFSRFKKNAEAGIGEDKEQLIDRKEKSSEKKEEVLTSISEVLRKWLEFDEKMEKFDEMVEKGRKEILKDRKDISNKIIAGISGLEDEYGKRLKDLKRSIEGDYDKRLIDLEESIEKLKKKKGEGAAFDFITSEEELGKVRDVVKTANAIPKEKLEMIAKISEKKSEIKKLKKIGEINIPPDKSEIITGVLDYITQASDEDIREMKELGKEKLTKEKKETIKALLSLNLKDEELMKLKLIMGLYSLLPKGPVPELDGERLLFDFLNYLHDRVNKIIHLLGNVLIYNSLL